MTPVKQMLPLLAFTFASITCISAQPTITVDEKTSAHLKKYRAHYREAMMGKQSVILQVYYADNIRLMTEFQKTVTGNANVAAWYTNLLSRFDVKGYSRNEIEMLDLGKMIMEDGVLTLQLVLKSTGKEYEVSGKYLDIWEKRANDTPVLITTAWNYNRQPDIGGQMRFAEVPVTDVALQPHLPVNNDISFELAALNRLMEATISQHDAKVWCRFYADDAVLFAQRNPFYVGRKAIDGYIETHVNEMPVFEKLDIHNDRIDNLGEYVIEYASHIAVWRNGESSGVGVGKDLRIWRRQKDGSLKIFRHIGMYD